MMLGRLFQKKGAETRTALESPPKATHWSEVDRKFHPRYSEWIAGITKQLRDDYRASLPEEISKKYKRKFASVGKVL
jgi:hypothetical protein